MCLLVSMSVNIVVVCPRVLRRRAQFIHTYTQHMCSANTRCRLLIHSDHMSFFSPVCYSDIVIVPFSPSCVSCLCSFCSGPSFYPSSVITCAPTCVRKTGKRGKRGWEGLREERGGWGWDWVKEGDDAKERQMESGRDRGVRVTAGNVKM